MRCSVVCLRSFQAEVDCIVLNLLKSVQKALGIQKGGNCNLDLLDIQSKPDNLVNWCFEPSQPIRIITGPKTNFNLSHSYSAHKSLYVSHNSSSSTPQLKYFTQKITTVKTLHTKFNTTSLTCDRT